MKRSLSPLPDELDGLIVTLTVLQKRSGALPADLDQGFDRIVRAKLRRMALRGEDDIGDLVPQTPFDNTIEDPIRD